MPLRPDSIRPRHPLEICWQRVAASEIIRDYYLDRMTISYPVPTDEPGVVQGFVSYLTQNPSEIVVSGTFSARIETSLILEFLPAECRFAVPPHQNMIAQPSISQFYTAFYDTLADCIHSNPATNSRERYWQYLSAIVPVYLHPVYQALFPAWFG